MLIPPGASESTHTSTRPLTPHNVLALQLHFGPLQFISGDAVLLQLTQFIHDNLEALTALLWCCTCINAHRSNMFVTGKPSGNAIYKATFLTHLDKEARSHVTTKCLTYHLGCIVIRISIVREREHQCQMLLLAFAILQRDVLSRLWPSLW